MLDVDQNDARGGEVAVHGGCHGGAAWQSVTVVCDGPLIGFLQPEVKGQTAEVRVNKDNCLL